MRRLSVFFCSQTVFRSLRASQMALMAMAFFFFTTAWALPSTELIVLQTQLRAALETAENGSTLLIEDGNHWNLPLYMGANYVSQYYLLLNWLAQNPSSESSARNLMDTFPSERFREQLLQSQLADGSWQPVPEDNLVHGNLDATIANYWALKALGVSTASAPMLSAKRFVLQGGGIEHATTFTRVLLSLFGNLSWSSVPWAPLFLLHPQNPDFINIDQFPQWVRPHIVPISYLRSLHVQRDLGPTFALDELHGAGKHRPPLDGRNQTESVDWVASTMLKTQTTHGSWGGYTSATLFTLAALNDYQWQLQKRQPSQTLQASWNQALDQAQNLGLSFVSHLYVNEQSASTLLGSVCDGRYWDSILLLQALTHSQRHASSWSPLACFLIDAQVANGGIPFGEEFESTPDVDDTSELITTLSRIGDAQSLTAAQRGLNFLLNMQNDDGGWGAFDRNNNGNFILREFAKGLSDSATLFDPSTPDVTGHALEAMGSLHLTIRNSKSVRDAVAYLEQSAEPSQGIWAGRWGVNYIYGTSAAISGLLKVGVPQNESVIQNAVTWLLAKQNPDGGYGESTNSYQNLKFAGVGKSTASQTAWALLGLVRAGQAQNPAAQKAAAFLLSAQNSQGVWQDSSVVGTGHSGVVYIVYPSYPIAFPILALSEYLEAISASMDSARD